MRHLLRFDSPATLFLCAATAVATSCSDPALRDRQCSGQESYRVGFYRVNGGPRVTYYANRGGIRAAPGDTVVYESDGGSPRAPVCTGDVSVSRDDLTFTFRFGAGEASCQLS